MGADHPTAWCHDYDGGRAWYTGGGHTIESYAEPQFRAAPARRHPDRGRRGRRRLRRVADQQLREGDAGQQHQQPDGAGHRPGRPGLLHRARRPGAGHQAGHRPHRRPRSTWTCSPATRTACSASGSTRTSPPTTGSTSTTRRTTACRATGCPGSPSPATPSTRPARRCVLQVDHPAQHVLPRGRQHGLRRRRQPLPGHRRQHQPVRVRRVHPDRRAVRPAGLRRAAHRRQHQRPARQGAADPPGGRRHVHRPGRQPVPAGHRADPARDLRDGLPQPVPDRHRPADRHAATSPTTARTRRPPNPNRGPEGTVEWNIVTQPGNYGWPYCLGDNYAYNDYTFPSGPSGPKFNCAAPVNNSPNNTGLTNLPPAIPATVDYDYSGNPLFPEIGGGGAPMGGPVYRYDAEPDTSDRKWPAYYDGKALFGEWNQNKMYTFQLDADGTSLVDINQLLTGMTFMRPMDFEFGPDGALYLIEWGTGFGGNNDDSGVYRIDYVAGDRAPIAVASGEPDVRAGAADRAVLQRGLARPGRRHAHLRLDFGDGGTSTEPEPEPHLHRRRQLHRPADGHRPGRPHRGRERADHRRQHRADGHHRVPAGRRLLRLGRPGRLHGRRHRPGGRRRSTATA